MPVLIAALVLMASLPALAQTATPRANTLAVEIATDLETTFVVAETLPGITTRIGFYITCRRTDRTTEAGFSFGAFPRGKPVQAAIRTPSGNVERFGPVVRGSPRSGFHSPTVTDPRDIQRFLAAAFHHRSLISNGHNSVWNELGTITNQRIRTAIADCLDSL